MTVIGIAVKREARPTIKSRLPNVSNKPVIVALTPGNGTAAGDKNTLYFSAGPSLETHGLFGSIIAAPPAM